MTAVLGRLLDTRLIAVLRADSGESLIEVGRALAAGGVDAMEVTFTVPQAHRVIEKAVQSLGDGVLVGAGTVLDAETARIAILAGAAYVVSPHTDEKIIEMCRRYSVPVMAGALTPTEIVRAWQAGADIVKVFPADAFGPSYLKALRGPFPQVRLMPTGGVTVETASDFLAAGACALGAGSSLVEKRWMDRADWESIRQRAAAFRAVVPRASA